MPDMNAALAELAVMKKLVTILEPLTPDARGRVLRWLYEQYGIGDGPAPGQG